MHRIGGALFGVGFFALFFFPPVGLGLMFLGFLLDYEG